MAAKPKNTRARPGRRRSTGRGEGYLSAAALKELLAVELFTCLQLALRRFGWQRPAIARAMRRALTLAQAPRVSGPYLADRRALAEILQEWSRNPAFLDTRGKPRILDAAGGAGTFASLAKRFLPHLSVEQVIAMACEHAEVVRRPGGRVALLGSVLVRISKSDEATVAHIVRQIDELASTALHNRRQRRLGRPKGRMERASYGVIPRKEFEGFMKEFRPHIYDLLRQVDAGLGRRAATSSRGSTAVGVSVHVSEEPDLKRAGARVFRRK